MVAKRLSLDAPVFAIKGEGRQALGELTRDVLDLRRDIVEVVEDHADLLDIFLTSNLTINVPSDYADPTLAWDYLKTKILTPNVTARINVADGTYSIPNRWRPEHPQGAQISVVGNQTNPENCILRFTHGGSEDGVYVGKGYTLGFLDGFTIDLPAKAFSPNVGSGLIADANGTIICGLKMRVLKFYFGAVARNGGHLRAAEIYVDESADSGIFGFMNGSVDARNGQSYNSDDGAQLGTCVNGEALGAVLFNGGQASGGNLANVQQFNDGHVRTVGTVIGEDDRIVMQRNELQARSESTDADVLITPKNSGLVDVQSPFTSDTGLTVAGSFDIKISGVTYEVMLANKT